MTTDKLSVIVIGAGAAGLSAASELAQAGLSIHVIEARNRLGGRIWSIPQRGDYAVELGAEFVHGRSPEITRIAGKAGATLDEIKGESWFSQAGVLQPCDFFEAVDSLFSRLPSSGTDNSFADFLDGEKDISPELRQWALDYVRGFHAADPAKVSARWIRRGIDADKLIEGDRQFRVREGYSKLIDYYAGVLRRRDVILSLETSVESIDWSDSSVTVNVIREGKNRVSYTARAGIIAVPLGVLQAPFGERGHIEFRPDVRRFDAAAAKLAMGQVQRATLRFTEMFWDAPGHRDLRNMTFLFSHAQPFPTWWTLHPTYAPVLTGWSPAPYCEQFAGQHADLLRTRALDNLVELFGVDRDKLDKWCADVYAHDWQTDPFARGAYSYALAGGDDAYQDMMEPFANTLYFAGEHTDHTGHQGTVHGAISSGRRAAFQLIERSVLG